MKVTRPADKNVSLENTAELIQAVFDEKTMHATEACLAAHATLLLDGASCFGLMLVGPSGTGKTTVLRLFEHLDEVYRTDQVTQAAFVSHNAALDEDELEAIDLLPKITNKTLVVGDMGPWFSGPREVVEENMSVLATLMDGNGFTRSTGVHGSRGYDDDRRFNFLAATTPLDQRAWNSMGHVGNRFVFHEVPNSETAEEIKDAVFSDDEYSEKIENGRRLVTQYVESLWGEWGGYGAVEWPKEPADEVKDAIHRLAKLVAHARAPHTEAAAQVEGKKRITGALYDLARGRALLDGRTRIEMSDLDVVGRVALSTMHAKRRPLVRALVNPDTPSDFSTAEVQGVLGVSDKTAKERMKLLGDLGIGVFSKGTRNQPHNIKLSEVFEWPEGVTFPNNRRT